RLDPLALPQEYGRFRLPQAASNAERLGKDGVRRPERGGRARGRALSRLFPSRSLDEGLEENRISTDRESNEGSTERFLFSQSPGRPAAARRPSRTDARKLTPSGESQFLRLTAPPADARRAAEKSERRDEHRRGR